MDADKRRLSEAVTKEVMRRVLISFDGELVNDDALIDVDSPLDVIVVEAEIARRELHEPYIMALVKVLGFDENILNDMTPVDLCTIARAIPRYRMEAALMAVRGSKQ